MNEPVDVLETQDFQARRRDLQEYIMSPAGTELPANAVVFQIDDLQSYRQYLV